MRGLALVVAAGGLLAATTLSMAQDAGGYPDMRGRWKGTNDGVVLGVGAYHRDDAKPGEPRTVKKEFTLDIKGQDGGKFWGEIVSKEDTGPVLGVIAGDRQTIHLVDNAGGHINGKLIGPGRFEMCYLRPGKDIMVAACNVHTKQ
jgi:hypothetical protein